MDWGNVEAITQIGSNMNNLFNVKNVVVLSLMLLWGGVTYAALNCPQGMSGCYKKVIFQRDVGLEGTSGMTEAEREALDKWFNPLKYHDYTICQLDEDDQIIDVSESTTGFFCTASLKDIW